VKNIEKVVKSSTTDPSAISDARTGVGVLGFPVWAQSFLTLSTDTASSLQCSRVFACAFASQIQIPRLQFRGHRSTEKRSSFKNKPQ